MPLKKVTLRPGVSKQLTQTANEGGWSDANLVRWRGGMPETVGGWRPLSSAPIPGVARDILTWARLDGTPMAAVGTHKALYAYQGDIWFDITPARRAATLTDPFTTASSSAVVTVAETAHGASAGDTVVFAGASEVGGLTLSGRYDIASVVDSNTYTVVAAASASGSATGGGTVTTTYLIPPGAIDTWMGMGWGLGTWGTPGTGGGGWGDPRTAAPIHGRTWFLDHWGEDLIANVEDGPLYYWTANTLGRATLIPQAPQRVRASLVAMPERHVICLGCSDPGTDANFDPMMIRFSDVEDFTSWTATATNSAGSFRIQGGTRIMAGANTTNGNLIWTDTALHLMRFVGGQLVYRFDQAGSNCGLIGPHAACTISGSAIWMGNNNFFKYDGGAPVDLDCPIWAYVFDDINRSQAHKIFCGTNTAFNEVLFFYPSAGSMENNRVVGVNYADNTWWIGKLERTVWQDADTFDNPLASGTDSILYQHECADLGIYDGNGAALDAYAESGYFDIDDGTYEVTVDRIIPDFQFFGANPRLRIYVKVTDAPAKAPRVFGPFTVTSATQFVTLLARGRQMAIRIESPSPGAWWRLGAMRFNGWPDGRV